MLFLKLVFVMYITLIPVRGRKHHYQGPHHHLQKHVHYLNPRKGTETMDEIHIQSLSSL